MNKKFITIALLGTMTLSSLALPTQVLAEEYNHKIEEAQKEADNTQTLINEKNNQLNEIQTQVSTTEAELKTITNEIANNEEKTDALAKEIQKAQSEMKTLQAEIEALEVKIAQRNEKLKEQARTIQTSGFSQNYIDFVLESESLSDVIGRIDVVTDLVKANKILVQEQVADQEAVVNKSEQTEQKITQQNAIAMELEETRNEMDIQLLEKEVIVAQLAIEKSTTEEDISAYMAQKESAEQQVAQFTNVQAEVEAQLLEEELLAMEAEEAAQVEAVEEEETSVSTEAVAQEQAEGTTVVAVTESESNNQSPVPSYISTPSQNNDNQSDTNVSENESQADRNQKAKEQKAREKAQKAQQAKAKAAADKAKEKVPVVSSGSVLQVANSLTGKGIPYASAGNTTSGFDCSGFTKYVFAKAGKSIPRNSYAQYASSSKVTSPQAGDLVFFSKSGSPSGIFHVAIYTGSGNMVGSQSSTGPGKVNNFKSNPYWGKYEVFYGRY